MIGHFKLSEQIPRCFSQHVTILSMFNWFSEKHEKRLEEVFETKKLDDTLYIKFNRSKFMEYLKAKCEVLIEKVKVSNMLEGSGRKYFIIYAFYVKLWFCVADRLKRYAAHIIKDCLSKENAKLLDEALGLQADKENEPPAKKAKVNFLFFLIWSFWKRFFIKMTIVEGRWRRRAKWRLFEGRNGVKGQSRSQNDQVAKGPG